MTYHLVNESHIKCRVVLLTPVADVSDQDYTRGSLARPPT
jgi:hypothetical protein